MSKKDGLPCVRCNTKEWDKKGNCKNCTRERTRQWKIKNRDGHRANCRKWQKANGKKPTTPAEIEKSRQYKNKWKHNNQDKVTAMTHNRRAKKKGNGGSYTAYEWKQLCDFYDNKCLCCGCDNIPLSVDHVVPIDKGGSSNIDNLQPLCLKCNMKKQRKVIDYRPKNIQRWTQPSLLEQS